MFDINETKNNKKDVFTDWRSLTLRNGNGFYWVNWVIGQWFDVGCISLYVIETELLKFKQKTQKQTEHKLLSHDHESPRWELVYAYKMISSNLVLIKPLAE